ncbi:portal protein [Pseudovibrio exalbescens]|uniref:portal protein n=1 Tax=Pseudovibrio exalbescens TaxID=197461 RepID=UPI00236722CA|nr:portal protein [Pseudovibrio exalbescens]MDD7908672.1 portal protein [Pseudovibrio exalbescens]
MTILKSLAARRKIAQQEYEQHKPLRDEAFDYAIPYRRSAATGESGKGEARVDKAFDQTAIVSAFRFSGKLWQDLIGSEMFQLAPGDVLPQKMKDELAPALERISKVCLGLASNGEFDNAFIEMALDLSAGTGAMLILEGDRDFRPARFIAVPIDEILLEPGPYGDVAGVFWCRKWSLRQIEEMFPDGNFGAEFKRRKKDDPEQLIKFHQDCVWDPKKKRWMFYAHAECDKEKVIAEKEYRTSPWITPRYFRVPGEVYGRGPVNLAMPSIKTLNTAQRLTLQGAAIALLGIYTAVDDGVFNPDMADMEPGSFWKVARNGGVLGPSVQRFPDPRLDLNNIVLQDLRMGVQTTMMDQALPPDGAAVRSATEILERVKRLASDHTGAFGRLVLEIIVPVARRLIEIAYNMQLISDAPEIDQVLVKVKVTSPLATARAAEKMQKLVQWIEMCMAILQQDARKAVHLLDALIHVGREMGVPEEMIVTAEQREQMEQQETAMMAAQAAATLGAENPEAMAALTGAGA